MRALGRRGSGPTLLAQIAFKSRHGLGGLCPFFMLNEPWGPDGPIWWPGDRVSRALGLGGPQTPDLWHKTFWEVLLQGRPSVRVSPKEAHRRKLTAQGLAEWWTEIRTLGRGSVAQGFWHGGPSNIARFSQCPAITPILNERWGPDSPMWQLGDTVSLALGLGGP